MIAHIILIIIGIIGCIIGLKTESLFCYICGLICITCNIISLFEGREPKPEQIKAKTVQVDTLITIQNGVRDTTYVITKID